MPCWPLYTQLLVWNMTESQRRFHFIIHIMLCTVVGSAGQVAHQSLLIETFLHPGDAATAYTYQKGEWSYHQAITPYPSWAWWGISDRLTVELDFEAWLGGVPSLNLRYGIFKRESSKLALAYETMLQYLPREIDQFENLDFLRVARRDLSWYHHFNLSWDFSRIWRIHLSGGFTWANYLQFSQSNMETGDDKIFEKLTSPDISLALDWRPDHWMGCFVTGSYGSTFLYADNIPRKLQLGLATRMAPFLNNRKGFLRAFRFELAFIHVHFPDVRAYFSGPIGFIYWTWKGQRKK